jgi:hypothetical protein
MPAMNDPRMNSMHLGDDRRERFRHARERLLDARGSQTCYFEAGGPGSGSRTLPPGHDSKGSPPLDCCLMDTERVYPLKVGINTVGRSSENDVVVQDAFISRRHCAILVHVNRGCELHDTASKNGTFLNGSKLSRPTRLKSGDQIRVCDRQFIFVVKGQPLQSASDSQTLAG